MAQEIIPIVPGSLYPVRPGQESVGWKATKQFLFVIFKWRRLILSLFLVFTVAAAVAVSLKPPVYTATTKIMLKGDRMPMQISGLGNQGRTSSSPQVLKSEIELIRSREVLIPVAKKLLSDDGKEKRDFSEAEIDATIRMLAASTVPTFLPDTTVIRITYFAPSPKVAERNLSLIVDQYLEQQALIQSGSGKLQKFYEQEKGRVGVELRDAEDELKRWQERNKTISIDEQISSQLRMAAERESALQQTEAQVGATKAKIAALRGQLAHLPEREVTSYSQSNPAATKLKTDLVAAEVDLQDLLRRYTEKDRRVQEKRQHIAILKKEMAIAENEKIIGSETVELNPLRRNLAVQLADAQALLTSLASQKDTLAQQIRMNSEVLATLREKKVEVNRLSRTVELGKDAFLLYGKHLEEARIAVGLGKEQLANVALIEAPHATAAGDVQRRIFMVPLAAIVGLALGMAIAFGSEFFNNSLRTQEDAEHYLGLPVLAAIPDLRERPVALLS